MDQPFYNNNQEHVKSDAYQQQISQQYPPAPEQQQYAPPPPQQQQYPPPPPQQQYTPQHQQQNYPPQQQQYAPPPPQQQQYAPPPPLQQQYTPPPPPQQQVQMSKMPPQQQVVPPPPSHSTVIITSSGSQPQSSNSNNNALQNQQMALNAQLIQSLKNNTRGLPTSVSGATLPVHIFCNSCKQESVTKVTENPCTVYTWLWFFCCFYSVLVLLCFIPGICKTQHQFTHHCSNCGFKVGEKPAEC